MPQYISKHGVRGYGILMEERMRQRSMMREHLHGGPKLRRHAKSEYIRSYEYEYSDMQNFRWLPNNHHAKRDRRPRQEEHERVASAGEDYDPSHDIVFEDNRG